MTPPRDAWPIALLSLSLSLATPSAGRAQATRPADAPSTPPATVDSAARWSADSAAVARASVAWMRALTSRDTIALDSLMGREYRLSGPGEAGAGVDKATWIRNALTMIRTDSAGYQVLGFRPVAPDVVVGSGVLHWKMRLRGWPNPIRAYNVTDVWLRRDGRWQVVARDADIASGTLFRIGALLGVLGSLLLLGTAWAIRAWRRRRARARTGRVGAPAAVATA